MVPKDIKWREVRYHWQVYFLILPTLVLIALFQYFPAASGILHSFFRWNGADISEYVGLGNYRDLFASRDFWNSFRVAFILGLWNVAKMVPPLLVAICIHRCRSEKMQFLYRCLFVIPMVLPPIVVALIWRSFFFEATAGYLNQFLNSTGLYDLLCYLDKTLHWGTLVNGHYEGIFVHGRPPNWLGDPRLMLIACIVWGFPWVGSFAVLVHLAKLQNISKDIYEAAEIDGVDWWTKFTRIEFPLITSSIYLLLVFTIIDTLKDAATILALADLQGGPGGVVAVPALFMLRKAFQDNQMGYACAVGIILTIIVMALQKVSTLLLTWEDLSIRQRLMLRAGILVFGIVLLFADVLPFVAVVIILAMLPYGAVRQKLKNIVAANNQGANVRPDPAQFSPPAMRSPSWFKEFFLRASKHAVIWFVLASAMLPVYLMLIVSFKTNKQYYEEPATITAPLYPEMWSRAWQAVAPSIANSIYLSVSTTLLALAFAICGSYFFARLRLPFSGLLWNALLVLMMMPTVANIIPLFRLLGDLGLINTLSALILVGAAAGQVFSIFVLRNFMADLPQDLFEAAEIDGASHFQQLRTVVLPLSGTILGTIGVRLFIDQWNDFVLPLIVMRDEIRLPVMVQLQRLNGSYVKEFGPLMAGYLIASIPVVVLFFFSMKLFIKGMTEGAVKG